MPKAEDTPIKPMGGWKKTNPVMLLARKEKVNKHFCQIVAESLIFYIKNSPAVVSSTQKLRHVWVFSICRFLSLDAKLKTLALNL